MNEVNEASPAQATLSDLLGCPFCGGKAEFLHRGSKNKLDNNWTVACETEGCFIGIDGADWYLPKMLAAKMWNKRDT